MTQHTTAIHTSVYLCIYSYCSSQTACFKNIVLLIRVLMLNFSENEKKTDNLRLLLYAEECIELVYM